jgi:hypothetical protein
MSSTNTPFEPLDPNSSSVDASRRPLPAAALPCDKVAALIPAHSLGATDPEEAVMVNRRLNACPDASAELADYGKLTEALLYAAPPRQAPPQLAQRLRAAIGAPRPTVRSNPLLGARGARAAYQPAPSPVAPMAEALAPFNLTPPPKPVRRWSFVNGLVTAVGAFLVVANLALLIQNQQLHARQEALEAELMQQNKALIFLAAEEPQEVILPAAQENSTAQADVLWNNTLGIAVVYVRDFPELPPDQAYQLWLRKDDTRTSPGLFTVEPGGMGIFVFPIEQSLDFYDLMGITPEPAGGSPGPTGSPVVRGPL